MQSEAKIFRPQYLFHEGEFREKFELHVDAEGRIADVRAMTESKAHLQPAAIVRLPQEAMLPGLCNAHSHAFQRMLRGIRPKGKSPTSKNKTDFWSWRKHMYELAARLTPEQVHATALLAYLEMARTGITSVGEFHYLHHDPKGMPYANGNELGLQILNAAERIGIRICLLDCAYERAGYKKTLDPVQKRFCDANPEAYLRRLEELKSHGARSAEQSFGMAIHSVRALSKRWLKEIKNYRGHNASHNPAGPLHMHLQEQPAEIKECRAEYKGKSPVAVVKEMGLLSPEFTAIHFIHAQAQDRRLFAKSGGRVCACPTTERDLGDGILDARALADLKIPFCLGTDSQVMINLWEDAREVEQHLRLKELKRNILRAEPASQLFQGATREGAVALGLPAGELEKGRWADFITLDLNHLSLIGATRAGLLVQMMFSGSADAVRNVYVGGKQVMQNGRHAQEETLLAQIKSALFDLGAY